MFKIFVVILAIGILNVNSASVEDKISQYFKSDVFKNFQKHWQAHRRSFENAIQFALKESYGYRGMNVYVRRAADTLRITRGFHLTDNVIDLLLLDTTLSSLPHIILPEVTFALASNVLQVDAVLSKMIFETKYLLFRNQSNIVFSKADQNPFKTSPFSYQQVQKVGQLAIVAEGCMLVGYALVKLSGSSINLGHETFHLKDCKFSVEISPYYFGGPPVIAPYFSEYQRMQLQALITRPIREEMVPKLQAAMFSYINASLIFGDYLPKFSEYQDNVYKDSTKYLDEIVQIINNQTVELGKVTLDLKPVAVWWSFTCPEKGQCWNHIYVSNVTLYGLDTLYSSHTGGPFKIQETQISEAFRFNSMMVRGNICFENNTVKGNHEFVAEIRDFTVNVEMDLNKTEPIVDPTSWRVLELSIIELEHYILDREASNSFVHGYLINRLPRVLGDHVYKLFVEALRLIREKNKEKTLQNKNECRH